MRLWTIIFVAISFWIVVLLCGNPGNDEVPGETHNKDVEAVESAKLKDQTQQAQDQDPQGYISLKLRKLRVSRRNIPGYSSIIYKVSKKHNIDPLILVSLIHTESNFRHNAVSPDGHRGLMQASKTKVKDVYSDISGGTRVLKEKLKRAHGNLPKALAYYKGGDNPAAHYQAKKVLKVYNKLKIEE